MYFVFKPLGLSFRRTGLVLVFCLTQAFVFFQTVCFAQNDPGMGKSKSVDLSCPAIEIFTRQGCPHCARAKEFLQRLRVDYPSVGITEHIVPEDREQLERLFRLSEEHGIQRPGVPAFLICENFFIGFDSDVTTGEQIKQLLGLPTPVLTEGSSQLSGELETSLFGKVSVERFGMPLFTIVIGLIDGFNPCAMWVLLMLLSLLVNLRSRKRLLLIAGTFVFVSGAVYFAFMAAWLNLFFIIGFSRTLQVIIGLIALVIGTIHIKDFLALKKGVSLSIPDSARPAIYTRMRRVIYAENMAAAFIAVITVAVLVNLVELLCTAGLPAVYTQILSSRELSVTGYYGYLLLYNLAYIFDDALMVGIVVFTLSSRKMQEVEGRWLKLVSGIVIAALGALLIAAPEVLV